MIDQDEVIDLTKYDDQVCNCSPFHLLKAKAPNVKLIPQLAIGDIIEGRIQSVLLMNFCVDLEYLVHSCPILTDVNIPVCCLHGSKGQSVCTCIYLW